jgi:hypothetical protein
VGEHKGAVDADEQVREAPELVGAVSRSTSGLEEALHVAPVVECPSDLMIPVQVLMKILPATPAILALHDERA